MPLGPISCTWSSQAKAISYFHSNGGNGFAAFKKAMHSSTAAGPSAVLILILVSLSII